MNKGTNAAAHSISKTECDLEYWQRIPAIGRFSSNYQKLIAAKLSVAYFIEVGEHLVR